MSPVPFLYLHTTGHISGKPHEIEIWYVLHAGCAYIIAEKREAAHWVQNIRAQPAIHYRLGDTVTAGIASIPSDAALIGTVQALMQTKHNWSDGLVVQLCPQPPG